MIFKRMLATFFALSQLLVVVPSEAARFKGYNRTPKSDELEVVKELPLEIEQFDTHYFISISRRAALYRFPRRTPDEDKQFKSFFEDRIKFQKPLQFTIDLVTGEILFVEDISSTKTK